MTQDNLISIICPAFNHERYVESFFKSILNQSYQNFEIIFLDDCSTDKTFEIAEKYASKDSRIKCFRNEFNSGVNYSLNEAFNKSSGNIIMIVASDDELNTNALNILNDFYKNNSDTEFTVCNLLVIDENSDLRKDYENSKLPLLKKTSNTELLHDSFFNGNKLYAPGMSFKRHVLEKLMPEPFGNIIYQDYAMNIRALLNFKLGFIKDCLVKYRILTTSLSNSGTTANNLECLEELSILEPFREISDIDLLKEIFKKEIQSTRIEPKLGLSDFFLGYMAIQSEHYTRKVWGYQLIKDCYSKNISLLQREYNFVFKDLLMLGRSIESPFTLHPVNIKDEKFSKKLLKLVFSIKRDKLYTNKHRVYILGFSFLI